MYLSHHEFYTLSLHDALPILLQARVDNTNPLAYGMPDHADFFFDASPAFRLRPGANAVAWYDSETPLRRDRKSTRLNSSHRCISYAVFCLKKKKKQINKSLPN